MPSNLTLEDFQSGKFSGLESDWWYMYDQGLGVNAFENWAYPGFQQFVEWSQQMIATMYENQWNSEQERMRRMQEAGINPYAAAQGIAGVGGSTGSVASSPSSAVGKGADALSSVGNAAANLLSAGGSAFGNSANGIATLSKLRGEIEKIDSETQLNFANLGFTKLQSRALSTQLKYMDYKERMSCYQALANYNNTTAQYDILKQEHLNKVAELDKIIAETNLTYSLDEKAQAEADKIAEETRWQKADNDFWEQHGYLRGSPFYEALRDAAVNGKPIDVDGFGDIVAGYEGKIAFARENAVAQASWNYRPKTLEEAGMFVGKQLGDAINDLFKTKSPKQVLQSIFGNPELSDEFESAYDEARDILKANYRYARKAYIAAKRSGANSASLSKYKKGMDDAKLELDAFTRDKFAETLSNNAVKNDTISK